MNGTRGMRLPRFSIPLSVSLFTILASTVGVIAGALTIYGFLTARGAIRDIGGDLLIGASKSTVTEIQRAIEPAVGLAELGALLPDVAAPPDINMHPASQYLRETLRTYPSLYSAYMGFADGRFYQIIALDAENGLARKIHHAPPNAAFLRRIILPRADGQPMEVWGFLDGDGRIVGSRAFPDSDFDPRTRPWYTAAQTKDHRIVTPIYTFASLGLPGLTAARRFDARIPGVFGIDLTVGDLSYFLADLEVTPHTRLAIVSSDGIVVATPGLAELLAARREFSLSASVLTIDDIKDPALAEAAQSRIRGDEVARREIAGEPYLLNVRSIRDEGGLDLRVLVAAPEADFVVPLLAMRNRSLLFSALVLALALPVAYLIARRMSVALARMAEDARRIRELDLEERPEIRSFVSEIQTLGKAMSMMRSSLQTFGLYVPKALVRQIVQSGGGVALGGIRHEVTLMFTDITDFTALAEHVPPEELLTRTSALFEEIDIAIRQHRGIIDKFIGDAVMVVWNAPQPVENHPRLACLAALEANRRIIQFNRNLAAKSIPPMQTRFGIHTGAAVVGNVGCSDRLNYTAVGSAVNMAARMEGLNKVFGTQILVSGETARRAGSGIVFRWLDTVVPKGGSEPMEVFALCGVATEIAGIPPLKTEEADFIRRWNRAQELLRKSHDWTGAAAAFRKLAKERPHDPFVAKAAETAAGLVGRPEDAWSGITVMHEK